MRGVILNYARGKHNQRNHHMLVEIEGVRTREEASRYIGRKVVWKSPRGKRITGKILRPHGEKGVVRVYFEVGLPGQALGDEVIIR
ncbi:50S ribosomal protein L35ae [Palaeococcus ferrophilus]|uniref:50S ribosomal protein L35ae n=1 Tax=Palaeococcus ferrophilus TaxID=83868 RepID=UPI00064F9678|nr:50S ribosomal protein L35ae [Palaeococcus ferrophilus]